MPDTVVHVVPGLFGGDGGITGGAERYALELARHMAERVPTKLVTFADRGRRERIGHLDVEILGAPWYVRGQRTNPLSLALLGHLREATVVHCHQRCVMASSLSALVCRLTGRRVFVTDLGGGGWDVSGYVSTDRWYHGHLHISEYSRRLARQTEVPWAHVIFGGVDAARFSPGSSVPPERDTVLFVGRILPHKGIDVLIEAATPDMKVEIVGPAGDARFLSDLHGLAAGKNVRFRHDCDDIALVAAYGRARCVVLPSVYRDRYGGTTTVPELLGQALLEGMACEAPVVSSDVASLPEVVDHGVTGFVVPAGDVVALRARLRWLHDHPEEAQAMGRAGRRRVLERFSWPGVVERCLAIYAGAVSPSAADGRRRVSAVPM